MSNNDDKTNLVIGINEIKRLIPHRYPFLMIDKVIDLTIGIKATGIKNVTFNEPHFMGHFPEGDQGETEIQIKRGSETLLVETKNLFQPIVKDIEILSPSSSTIRIPSTSPTDNALNHAFRYILESFSYISTILCRSHHERGVEFFRYFRHFFFTKECLIH